MESAIETVTISRREYERLKDLEKIDFDLLLQFKESLDDVKTGRIRKII